MSTKVEIGVMQKLLVTEVTELGKYIFVQLDTQEAYQVQDLSREIETHIVKVKHNPLNFEPGSRCYARASDGVLYRALVVSQNLTNSLVTVYFNDYGNSEAVDVANIFPPSGNYFELPSQALCCVLGDFIPNQSTWNDIVSDILIDKLVNQEVYGVFRSQISEPHPYQDAVLQDKDKHPCYNITLYQDEAGMVSYTHMLVEAGLGQFAICSENVKIGITSKVYVAFSDSPGRFWLQFSSNSHILDVITSVLADDAVTSSLKVLPRETIFPGVACCVVFNEDGMYYRAQTIDITKSGKVRVQFVDYGNSVTVLMNDLFELPSSLSSAPAQAVQCCLEGVRPLKTDWTLESCEAFSNGTVNIELDAQFVDELMPEVFTVVLRNPEIGSTISEMLVSSGCAQSSEQMSILGEPPPNLVKRVVQTPPILQLPTDYTTQKMEVGGTYNVTVPYSESPSVVWGQLAKFKSHFEEMVSKMSSRYKDRSTVPGLDKPAPGQPCAAQFANDKQWYRCRIERIDPPSKRAQVIFVDFGNIEIFKFSELKQLSSEFLLLPIQAISFSMYRLEPADGGKVWPVAMMSSFSRMTSSGVLLCEVVDLDDDGYPAVCLRDGQGRDIGEELVKEKMARWKDGDQHTTDGTRDHITRGSESRDGSTMHSSKQSHTLPPQSKLQQPPSQVHTGMGTGQPHQPKQASYTTQTLEIGHTYNLAVIFVDSLHDFYVQLSDQAPQLVQLMDGIAAHCSSDAARIPDTLIPGKPVLAQFTDDQAWYRAVITERNQGVSMVTFIDYGNKDTVHDSSLIEIPHEYLSLPVQAIHCSLDGVGVQVSPEAAKTAFNDLTLEEEGQGTVTSVRTDVSGCQVFAIDLSLADGTKPLSILVEGGHISIPRARLSIISPSSSPTLTEVKIPLFPVDTHIDVCISYVESPANFYVQLMDNTDILTAMTHGMNDVYVRMGTSEEVLFSLNPGVFCAAKFSEDEVWYRARILEVGGATVQVRFVDYGNEETMAASNLKTLRMQFATEACLAIRCTLNGISPDVAQSDDVVAKFAEIVADDKKLVAKFLKPFTSYSEPVPVQLYDTSGSDQDVAIILNNNMGQSQLQSGAAKVTMVPPTSQSGAAQTKIAIPLSKPVLNQSVNCTVTHVETSSELYCQLSSATPLAEAMLADMYDFYVEQNNGRILDNIEIGTICAAPFTDGSWYRVMITAVNSDLATVRYFDYGNSSEVNVSDLRGLDVIFSTDPPHALKCSLNGIRPIGKQEKWSEECCKILTEAILDQNCVVTILNDINNIFDIELTVAGSNMGQVLIRDGFAVAMQPPMATVSSLADDRDLDLLAIPPFSAETGTEIDVFVTFSESPQEIYCQPMQLHQDLDQLIEDIQTYCESEAAGKIDLRDVIIGDVVLVQYSDDMAWYRARVLTISETVLKVLFVDYGNIEETTSFRAISAQFCSLPAQAIHCSLLYGEQYTLNNESETSFNDILTGDENGFRLKFIEVRMTGEKSIVTMTRLIDGMSVLNHAVESNILIETIVTTESPGGAESRRDGGGNLDDMMSSGYLPVVMTPNVTKDGYVSHFETPLSFWVQLVSNESDLDILVERIAAIYGDTRNIAKLDIPVPKPGQVCCAQYNADMQWYRSIVEVVDSNGVRVHFVDYGNGELVSRDKVKILKPEFLEVPVQAVHCSLIGINPPTGQVWPDGSIAYFSSLILDNAITVQSMDKSSSGVWLVKLMCQNRDVAMEMVKKGVAKSDIKPGTEGQPSDIATQIISDHPSKISSVPVKIPELEIKVGDEFDVYISHLTNSPNEIYCQLVTNEKSINELMASLSDYYGNKSPPATLEVGHYCVAQYSGNNEWYRAMILNIDGSHGNKEGEANGESELHVTVQFVDFGNYETVPVAKVLGLNDTLGTLAQQALCCSLTHLTLQLPEENMARLLSLDMEQCYRVKVTSCLDNGRHVVELSNLEGEVLNDHILFPDTIPQTTPTNDVILLLFKELVFPVHYTLDVYVSSINSPSSFYCQPLQLADELESMMTELANTVSNESPPSLESVSPGMPCLAQFSDDNEWYRSRIISVSDNGTDIEVVAHFVDYGNSEVTTISKLHKCPDNLFKECIQTLHCSVFEPSSIPDVEWTEDTIEQFRTLLGEEPLSLTITSIDTESGLCVCMLSTNGDPIEFNPLLPPGLPQVTLPKHDRDGSDQSLPEMVAIGNSEITSQLLGISKEMCSEQTHTSSASSSSIPAGVVTIATTADGELMLEHSGGTSDDGRGVASGCSLPPDSNLNSSTTIAVNYSMLALKGSSQASDILTDETESSEEASDQGGGEGEPLIKAPFTLTLSIPEEFEATVVYVESPSFLFLQRLDCQSELDALSSDIEQYCTNFAEKQHQEIFQKGDFVLAQYEDEVWYRAKVIEAGTDPNVQVFFIDFGNTELIAPDKMVMCAQNFLDLPCQAISCSLANVPRRDSWPEEYKILIDEQVCERTVHVKVVHPASEGMRATVNISDVETGADIAQPVLAALQDECDRGSVSSYVIPEEPGEEVREEEEVKEEREGEVTVSNDITLKLDLAAVKQPLTTEEERDTTNTSSVPVRRLDIGSSHDVYIMSCDTPHSFIIQLANEVDSLDSMSTALESVYGNEDTSSLTLPRLPAVEEVVCGQFSEDSKWYRAKVIGMDPADPTKVELLFLDYGNSEFCDVSTIRALSPSLPSHPAFAIECFLAGIEPLTGLGSFSVEAGEHLMELTRHGETVCKAEIQFADSAGHYGVNLYSGEGVNVAESLIDAHLATALMDTPRTTTSNDDITTDQSDDISPAVTKQPLCDEDPLGKEQEKPVLSETQISSNKFATSYPTHTFAPNTIINAVITRITSLDEFYCQLLDYQAALDDIMESIASRKYQVNDNTLTVSQPSKGLPVCACFTEDDAWYRAEIITVVTPEKIRVNYVDYGNSEEIDIVRVKRLEIDLAESLPPVIVCCSIPSLTDSDMDPSRPSEGAWDLIWPKDSLAQFKELLGEEQREVRLVPVEVQDKDRERKNILMVNVFIDGVEEEEGGEGKKEIDVRASLVARLLTSSSSPQTVGSELAVGGNKERDDGYGDAVTEEAVEGEADDPGCKESSLQPEKQVLSAPEQAITSADVDSTTPTDKVVVDSTQDGCFEQKLLDAAKELASLAITEASKETLSETTHTRED